ncbi:HAMP domain-containing protein [Actinocorallia sp. API 0066]|uniref:ATP-binding protein n=1 Tax=Actinocorallia sp. API 0066 TaxID=2896846 RepID=UPI001E37487D|nr:ATP-binding protein [Actinocorallia sp. API 0066]MCD0452094.1 HAMP domain-containing protein [Actinocorallia sp. API 0066]
MSRVLGSVRARTTLGATVVVALALVAAAVPVVLALRADLLRGAGARAEAAAARVASQWASGVSPAALRLPDEDTPVQVVDPAGRVVATSPDLTLAPLPAAPPHPSPEATRTGKGGAQGDTGTQGGPPDTPESESAQEARDDTAGDDEETSDGPVADAPGDAENTGEPEARDDAEDEGGEALVFLTRKAVFDDDTGEYRFAGVTATSPAGASVVVYAGAELASARAAVATTVRGMLGGLPLVLLVVAASTWLVTRRALRPVEAITTEMAGITAAGDLARRVPVPAARDEIARLAVTTNRTLSALQRSTEQQRRFVADASHELRNPLASLRAQLEIALEHPDLLDLDGTVADVRRLQQLTTDLLLLARLDAGGARAPAVSVDLRALAARVLAERPETDRVPVVFLPEASPTVPAHPRRLARALDNLLDNAQRHAAERVTLTLAAEPGHAVLSVRDDGPGVPAEDRERIFARFVRRDDARGRDEGGAGLGLAIAREIAAASGGTLECREPPGTGALFVLRLPRH